MLPLKNRLKKKKEIESVLREKKGVKGRLIVLKKNKNFLEESKFCFIVPEKVSKKATERNKIKRRMREIIREKLPKIKKGFNIVVIALPGIEKESFWEMQKDLSEVLVKARLLK